MSIAVKLKAWRVQQGISQAKAAKLVGVKQPTWCNWEVDMLPNLLHAEAIERETGGAVTVESIRAAYEKRAADEKRERSARE